MDRQDLFPTGDIRPLIYFASVSAALACVMALMTRDQLTANVLPVHGFQWLVQVLLATLLVMGCHVLLQRLVPFRKAGPWLQLALSGAAGAILYSVPALFIDFAFGVDAWPGGSAEFLALWADEWSGTFWIVLFSWLAMNAPLRMGFRLDRSQGPSAETSSAKVAPAADPEPCVVERTDIEFAKSELQYLEIGREGGTSMVLGSLKAFCEEMPASVGIQVHRSWWVAFQAIEDVEKQGRQGELRLRNGLRIPVSRSRWREVEQAVREWNETAA